MRFPFPHRLELVIELRPEALAISTTLTATGDGRGPVAFGWHPYFQLPRAPRAEWELELPDDARARAGPAAAADRRGAPVRRAADRRSAR